MDTKTPNYAELISQSLRDRGESPDFIVGYLEGILNMLTDVYANQEVIEVLKRQLKYTSSSKSL